MYKKSLSGNMFQLLTWFFSLGNENLHGCCYFLCTWAYLPNISERKAHYFYIAEWIIWLNRHPLKATHFLVLSRGGIFLMISSYEVCLWYIHLSASPFLLPAPQLSLGQVQWIYHLKNSHSPSPCLIWERDKLLFSSSKLLL